MEHTALNRHESQDSPLRGGIRGLLAGDGNSSASGGGNGKPAKLRTLGILVCEMPGDPPFAERSYYRRLSELAPALKLDVAVLSPRSIDWERRLAYAYRWSQQAGRWTAGWHRLPDVLYDRCFFGSREMYVAYRDSVRKIREDANIRLLGHGLPGKSAVLAALTSDPGLAPLLPETATLHDLPSQLADWLARYPAVFLKPETGSQGKGVLAITRLTAAPPADASASASRRAALYEAVGRDETNKTFRAELRDRRELIRAVESFTRRRTYLIQPYLELTTEFDEPYDLRALVQKDARGLWRLAGIAARVGRPGGLTSNLHGGGSAERAEPLLIRLYGAEQAEALLERIRTVALELPPTLENHFGRLAELGLDLAVDRREQRLWLLEANSKPGRSVFARTADTAARTRSLWNPLRYARYLLDRIPGEEP